MDGSVVALTPASLTLPLSKVSGSTCAVRVKLVERSKPVEGEVKREMLERGAWQ